MSEEEFLASDLYDVVKSNMPDIKKENIYEEAKNLGQAVANGAFLISQGVLKTSEERMEEFLKSQEFAAAPAYEEYRKLLGVYKPTGGTYAEAYEAYRTEAQSWQDTYDFMQSALFQQAPQYDELRAKVKAEAGGILESKKELQKEILPDTTLFKDIETEYKKAQAIPSQMVVGEEVVSSLEDRYTNMVKTPEQFMAELGIKMDIMDSKQQHELELAMAKYYAEMYNSIFNGIAGISSKGQEFGQQLQTLAELFEIEGLEKIGELISVSFEIIGHIGDAVNNIKQATESWETYSKHVEAGTEGSIEGIAALVGTVEPTIGAIIAVVDIIITLVEFIEEGNSLTEAQLLYLDRNTTAIESLTDVIRNVSTEVYNAPQAFAYGYAVAADNQVEAQQFVPQNNYVVQDTVHTMQSELYEPKYFTKEGYANTPNYYDSQILYNTTNTNKFEINVTVNGNAEPEAITQSVEEGVKRAFKSMR
jgi:hypothetical protein